MSNKEKLTQFIENLTNEEIEKIISYLGKAASIEEIVPPPPQNSFPQKREVSF